MRKMAWLSQVWPHLEAAGVSEVCLTYSGSGDSGSWEAPQYEGADEDALTALEKVVLTVRDETEQFDRVRNRWIRTEREVTSSIEDLLREVADKLVDHHYSGWENNSGGYGSVTFDIIEREIRHDHVCYVEHHESHTYDVEAESAS